MKAIFNRRERKEHKAFFYVIFARTRGALPFIVLTIFVVISRLSAFAQVTQAWVAKYNNGISNGTNQAVKMAVDAAGNIYVTGFSQNATNGNLDYATIKYSPNGSLLWTGIVQGYPANAANVESAALDSAGNFYVLWNSVYSVPYCTTKLAGSNGSAVWDGSNPTGNDSNSSRGLVIDNSSNVWITGAKYSAYYTYTTTQYGTYEISTNGAYAASSVYPTYPSGFPPGTTLSAANAIAVDAANNIYVTGYSPGTNSGNDIVTIKYDSNGNQIWLERYNGPGNGDDEGNAIAVDGFGNVYVTGYETTAAAGTEMVTIKYAPAALLQKQGNASILLQEQGEPGEAFDLQASTNLQTWLDLGTTNADTNGFVQFLDTNAPNFSLRFYLSLPQ